MSSERGKKRRLMEVYDDDAEDKVYRFKIVFFGDDNCCAMQIIHHTKSSSHQTAP